MPTAHPTTADPIARTRRQPPYAVVLHNDDVNTMEFVVSVLRKVFGYSVPKCADLMMQARAEFDAQAAPVPWRRSLDPR